MSLYENDEKMKWMCVRKAHVYMVEGWEWLGGRSVVVQFLAMEFIFSQYGHFTLSELSLYWPNLHETKKLTKSLLYVKVHIIVVKMAPRFQEFTMKNDAIFVILLH